MRPFLSFVFVSSGSSPIRPDPCCAGQPPPRAGPCRESSGRVSGSGPHSVCCYIPGANGGFSTLPSGRKQPKGYSFLTRGSYLKCGHRRLQTESGWGRAGPPVRQGLPRRPRGTRPELELSDPFLERPADSMQAALRAAGRDQADRKRGVPVFWGACSCEGGSPGFCRRSPQTPPCLRRAAVLGVGEQ